MSHYHVEKWKNEDLDEADGEITIFEKGAVDACCEYTLENFTAKIVTVSTSLLFKLYREVYGAEEHLTDENVTINSTCTKILYGAARLTSRYIKITVTPTGDDHSLRTSTDYRTDNLKSATEAA